jgi:hypothetical protein
VFDLHLFKSLKKTVTKRHARRADLRREVKVEMNGRNENESAIARTESRGFTSVAERRWDRKTFDECDR